MLAWFHSFGTPLKKDPSGWRIRSGHLLWAAYNIVGSGENHRLTSTKVFLSVLEMLSDGENTLLLDICTELPSYSILLNNWFRNISDLFSVSCSEF